MRGGNISMEIPKLCQIDGDDSGQSKSACYHGLGHGLASAVGFDLSKALTMCDLIPKERYKIDCGSGLIMELYEQGSFGHTQLEWPDDIPKFCSTLPGPYSSVCYTTAGLHEYGRSRDIDKAFKTCKLVPIDLSRECNVSIGSNFYYVFQGSVSKIIKACENNDEAIFLNCIEGAISASFTTYSQSKKGDEMCSQIEDELKIKCQSYLR
jgi:hypothetical protein